MRRDWKYIVIASVTFALVTYFMVRHLIDLNVSLTNFAIAYTLMFAYLGLTIFASLAATPHLADPSFRYDLLTVDVIVPVYNEDPDLLAAGIDSMPIQTRRPNAVWIIDDGSENSPLTAASVLASIERCRLAGIAVHVHRQENRGKRHAQVHAFERSTADIYVTVDSDTILDRNAVAELLYPFSKPTTMSVGGTAVGQNHKTNLLTRVVELGFVMAFLSGRLAEGYFGAVRVNCGIIAAYRAEVARENIFRYLTQTWLGQPVTIGDDRVLTIFALERGKAEFQANAIAYSALPIKMSHLVRQRLRWARSFQWGTVWLFRRPVRSPEFWFTVLQILGMVSFVLALLMAVVGTLSGDINPRLLASTVLMSIIIGATSTLRYVTVGRPDESTFSRFVTWLLSPLSSLLYMFVLIPLYWIAAVAPKPKGWGTRKVVEVGLSSAGHSPHSRADEMRALSDQGAA